MAGTPLYMVMSKRGFCFVMGAAPAIITAPIFVDPGLENIILSQWLRLGQEGIWMPYSAINSNVDSIISLI